MKDVAGFPGFEVEFTKEGQVFDENQVKELLDFLAQGSVTDLFVFSHGWNNDMDDARQLGQLFFGCVRDIVKAKAVAEIDQPQFAVMAVLWPSKKFADKDLIPSGAASLTSPEVLFVQRQLDDLKLVFKSPKADAALEKAKALVPELEANPAAREGFVATLRALMPKPSDTRDDASNLFFALTADEIFARLKNPLLTNAPPPGGDSGGAASIGGVSVSPQGGAAGLRDIARRVGDATRNAITATDSFVNRTTAAASNLLNYATYYQMKERAGLVGSTGVAQVLRRVRDRVGALRIHLIGHSFGGRLVTAAADALGQQKAYKPNSLTLLQAAFSHNGFAQKFDGGHDGFFRKVVVDGKVTGPILITCSVNDQAVGVAYPLASRLAGQQASALGDANDVYGGIGRNGAQKTPEADSGTLQAVSSKY